MGESYTLRQIYRDGHFPLLNRLNLALDCGVDGPATKFSGLDLGVDTEKLAYFALSLLWKGSLRNWSTLKQQATSVALGAFQEPIRKYLARITNFPNDVYVITTICTDLGTQEMIYAPWKVDLPQNSFLKFEILVRGIWFYVVMGDQVPPGTADLCSVNSTKRIVFRRNCVQDFRDSTRHFLDTATDLTKSTLNP
jgi:hypothetical protein